MKALVYTGPGSLSFREVDMPIAKENEVIVKVDTVGICGSDMHAFLGHDERRPPPLILGHEVAGVVVGGQRTGQRVTINPLVTCGICPACTSGRDNLCPSRQIISMPPREGGFAQFVAIPAGNLVEVPDDISLEQASMCEPIACGFHAVRLSKSAISKAMPELRALVIGGGAIGVGAALSLGYFGTRNITIVEPNDARRRYLCDATGFSVIDPEGLNNEADYDLVIDAVGIEKTRENASQLVSAGGVIMHIGLGAARGGLDVRRMTLQEVTFIGTYTYTNADFLATARAIFEAKLGSLDWYEVRPLSDGQKAFDDILKGVNKAPKIILKP